MTELLSQEQTTQIENPLVDHFLTLAVDEWVPLKEAEELRQASSTDRTLALDMAEQILLDREEGLTEGEIMRLGLARIYLTGDTISQTGMHIATAEGRKGTTPRPDSFKAEKHRHAIGS